ncbi:MAG TPA: D-glycero-beta-D-manno-heptose 1-phosphate adenylyltransferase [Candidatus Wujingus californicus]|uniref:D-glycero-beta-D-manno-heptose 1-phosphate adenylyltransferase n=1 Tax=Candidatus Wujingus californicus TaxID=3367618 RepID=UPI001D6E9A5A|nr:D-glycero-beta-D-manno-heptose 1-phosphate adenylyltransferase [Planctomycetota bacterium]MDO8131452.1 D-glycero-beta-D-manno-heptose 1-phosphate adenylyltransferase [Candidatus Brocadiales bacterium]
MDKTFNIVSNLKSPRIVVIGDLMLDKYVWGEVRRISQEAPIPIINVSSEDMRPGGAGSVINNLQILGANVFACGIMGDDVHGHTLLNIFKGMKVDTTGIFIDKSRPTILKMRLMGHLQTAGKGVQQLLRVDYEKTHAISADLESQLSSYLNKTVPLCDIVLVSDMNKGLLSTSFLKTIVTFCKKHNKIAIVDPKLSVNYSIYHGFTAMTPNRNEAELATGIKITDNDSLNRAGNKLTSSLSLEYCVITIDKDGMFLYHKSGQGRIIPTTPRTVFDVTGAGDMVLSIFGMVVGSGYSLEDAAPIANIAAGIEVGKIGATPVSKGEILDELMSGKGQASGKIKDIEVLIGILNEHRKKNDKIVFTNGCFDILHVGHIEYLKFARKQGDLLVVGLNSDHSVKSLKGPSRPFVSEAERAKMLAALEDVTYVTVFDDLTPEDLIKAVRPDILVKGEDWKDAGVVGREVVESYGGKVVLAPLVEGVSTTNIVSRIIDRHNQIKHVKETVSQAG